MTTSLLNNDMQKQVKEVFRQLKEPVEILFFGSKVGCEYCADTLNLMQEVVGLSKKLSVRVYDLAKDADVAKQYHVDKTPTLVFTAKDGDQMRDYGIRYAGIPSGHEFSSLVQDLLLVSGRDSGLESGTREFLKNLSKPVYLQVFVTPTWPYCPRAVMLAHQMALESPLVEAEAVEAMEFPELAERFKVSGVPHTTINEGSGNMIGAEEESHLVAEMVKAIGK